MDLIANKSFRYRGRALKPGDDFTADRKHGKVMLAGRRARESKAELGTILTPAVQPRTKRNPLDHDGDGKPGGSLRQDPSAELADARTRYKAKVGKRWGNGWSVEEINRRIAEHMAKDQDRPVTDPAAPQDAAEEAALVPDVAQDTVQVVEPPAPVTPPPPSKEPAETDKAE